MLKEKNVEDGKAIMNSNDYQNLLLDLKGIIANKQYQAYKAVDNIKVP